jgi:hypothetical protein
MMGIKHTLDCHCVLPQYRNRKNPVYHKFVTFSIIDDSNTTIPKYAQCNNCGVIHKVIDICKSEIITGRDDLKSIPTIDDIGLMIPDDIKNILEVYKADLATWEQVQWVLRNKVWNETIVLNRDTIDDEVQGKLLIIEGLEQGQVRIEPFTQKIHLEIGT